MPSKPEKANADRKKRYHANLEHERQRSRDYYALNKDAKIAKYDPVAQRQRYLTWKARNPDGLWVQWLKAGHGMLPEQWFAYWDEHDGKCYLCEELLPDDRSKIAIDHDHSCCGEKRTCRYCRRGLAHTHCNWLLGILREDPATMRAVCSQLFVANFERTQAATQALLAAKPSQEALPLGDTDAVA